MVRLLPLFLMAILVVFAVLDTPDREAEAQVGSPTDGLNGSAATAAAGAAIVASSVTPARVKEDDFIRHVDLKTLALDERTPYISAQCYTKTETSDGRVANPCYTCHAQSTPPNYISGLDLQLSYSFPRPGTTNPFTNLFEDRSQAVASISDEAILEYVRESNYRGPDGKLLLARALRNLPEAWDVDGDHVWDGYIPDVQFRFDRDGFDRTGEGDYTGWRAFGYDLFPGTFWPTNGSTDDVLIRLDEPFQQRSCDTGFDPQTYKINLAIVEAMVKRADVAIDPVDEPTYGVDLNRNGTLDTARQVTFDWAPRQDRYMAYVGCAKAELEKGTYHIAGGLFPEETEFAHTVRYIDPQPDGGIALAARMKEFRYARKEEWQTYSDLQEIAHLEARERYFEADSTKAVAGDFERGMRSMGWRYQGFIESRDGSLRPQNQEETFFCMGCHGGLSATTDTVFAFPRKFDSADAFQRGWYHWSQKGLEGTPEPQRPDGSYEYTRYLRTNLAGDEFRNNDEIMAKFFDHSGELKPTAVARLHEDVTHLIFPSRERALRLNKAYRTIVTDQDFVNGRAATWAPVANVHEQIEQHQKTGVESPVLR
jgi:hypothetical protein